MAITTEPLPQPAHFLHTQTRFFYRQRPTSTTFKRTANPDKSPANKYTPLVVCIDAFGRSYVQSYTSTALLYMKKSFFWKIHQEVLLSAPLDGNLSLLSAPPPPMAISVANKVAAHALAAFAQNKQRKTVVLSLSKPHLPPYTWPIDADASDDDENGDDGKETQALAWGWVQFGGGEGEKELETFALGQFQRQLPVLARGAGKLLEVAVVGLTSSNSDLVSANASTNANTNPFSKPKTHSKPVCQTVKPVFRETISLKNGRAPTIVSLQWVNNDVRPCMLICLVSSQTPGDDFPVQTVYSALVFSKVDAGASGWMQCVEVNDDIAIAHPSPPILNHIPQGEAIFLVTAPQTDITTDITIDTTTTKTRGMDLRQLKILTERKRVELLIEEGAWTEAMALAKSYYVGEADKRKSMRQKLFGNQTTGDGMYCMRIN